MSRSPIRACRFCGKIYDNRDVHSCPPKPDGTDIIGGRTTVMTGDKPPTATTPCDHDEFTICPKCRTPRAGILPCDDAKVMGLWRECGLPEYFLGNGGTNHKLLDFATRIAAKAIAETITEKAFALIHEGKTELPFTTLPGRLRDNADGYAACRGEPGARRTAALEYEAANVIEAIQGLASGELPNMTPKGILVILDKMMLASTPSVFLRHDGTGLPYSEVEVQADRRPDPFPCFTIKYWPNGKREARP